jgi:glutamine synthetase
VAIADNVARKAVNYMKSTGVADTAYFGPEFEFFVFDDVRYDQTPHSGYYFLDSAEGAWNTGRDERPNLGYKLRYKEGYFPCRLRRNDGSAKPRNGCRNPSLPGWQGVA